MPPAATTADGPAPVYQDADAIRDAVRQVLAQPDYELDRGAELPSVGWLRELFEWLVWPFRVLFDAMDGLSDGVRIVVLVVLALLLIALVAHIVWTLTSAFRTPRIGKLRLQSDEEAVVDPAVLEARAARLAEGADYVGACRVLLQAALARLEPIRERRFRPGLTNSELLREYATTPVEDPLRRLVGTIDRKWYGDEPCHAADFDACRESQARIHQVVRERLDATGV